MTEINAQFLDGVANNHGYTLCDVFKSGTRCYRKELGPECVTAIKPHDVQLKYDSCGRDDAALREWLDAKFV